MNPNKNRYYWITLSFIPIFFFVNMIFLTNFPSVHSDELWLKGIAEEMMTQGSFSITEPFYDLYPRVVHPFRWLYNLILMPALHLYNSVFALRFISLIFATLSLLIFRKILFQTLKSNFAVVIGMLLLVLNIQFIYSAHLGRQEMILLAFMLAGFLYLLKPQVKIRYLVALILLGIGIHPNSFLLGTGFAAILGFRCLYEKTSLRPLFRLIFWTSIGAGLYLIVGYQMNPDFLTGYFNYGSALGVDAPLTNRLTGFYWYWVKLYRQIGGTYDLFNIKADLIALLGLSLFWGLWFLKLTFNYFSQLFSKWILQSKPKFIIQSESITQLKSNGHPDHFKNPLIYNAFVLLVANALGLLIIGRYNQTAVVFFTPWIILLLLQTIEMLSDFVRVFKKIQSPLFTVNRVVNTILVLLLLLGVKQLKNNFEAYDQQRFYTKSYDVMLSEIRQYVPDDATVLANLNLIEAFQTHQFFDVRNLGYLKESPQAFSDYIEQHQVEYILLHEEMDYIARTSPKWDFLYVNTDYYTEMMTYIEKNTIKIAQIENPIYAMRISRFSGTYPWSTTIYKVK